MNVSIWSKAAGGCAPIDEDSQTRDSLMNEKFFEWLCGVEYGVSL
jgi:hypothetical protein